MLDKIQAIPEYHIHPHWISIGYLLYKRFVYLISFADIYDILNVIFL